MHAQQFFYDRFFFDKFSFLTAHADNFSLLTAHATNFSLTSALVKKLLIKLATRKLVHL